MNLILSIVAKYQFQELRPKKMLPLQALGVGKCVDAPNARKNLKMSNPYQVEARSLSDYFNSFS